MTDLTVQFAGLSGSVSIPVPEGSTLGQAREAAGIDEGLSVRSGGQALGSDHIVENSAVYVTAPPEAKQGA